MLTQRFYHYRQGILTPAINCHVSRLHFTVCNVKHVKYCSGRWNNLIEITFKVVLAGKSNRHLWVSTSGYLIYSFILKFIFEFQAEDSVGWQRGVLHYSVPSLQLFLFTSIYSLSGLQSGSTIFGLGCLMLVSILSHHIRDAVNHGLWLQPFLVTPKLSVLQYRIGIVVLPLAVAAFSKAMMGRDISKQSMNLPPDLV